MKNDDLKFCANGKCSYNFREVRTEKGARKSRKKAERYKNGDGIKVVEKMVVEKIVVYSA